MPSILVVEDDPGTRLFVVSALKVEGYAVQSAEDGTKALETARIQGPDVVITDVVMPGLSGPQLCAAIREVDRLRHAYIIMLTSQGGKDAKLESLRAGADDYVVKPASAAEILGRVEIGLRVLAAEAKAREAEAGLAAAADLRRSLRAEFLEISQSVVRAKNAMEARDPATVQEAIEAASMAVERALRVTRED